MRANVKVVSAAERRRRILSAVRTGESVQVAELAQQLGVSQMSVRRDLSRLAHEGKLTRVHGGAIITDGDEPPFGVIEVERAAAKQRVGAAAAELVEDGQTIMIDIGTTTLAFARHLHGRPLTVITSSLAIVQEFLPDAEIELVVLGGSVRRNYRSLVGLLAEDALRQVSADIAFLGTSGIRRDQSVMDTTMAETPIKRGMIAAAQRKVLLADGAKFAMGGTVRVCGLNEFDVLVTDAAGDEPALANATVEVVRA